MEKEQSESDKRTSLTITARYIRGIDLMYSLQGSFKTKYAFDEHSNTVYTVNPDNTNRYYSYNAFGEQLNKVDGDTNPFRYCAEYFDNETGNIYLRARYYMPSAGRFMTEDPIKDGLNWYVYCNNNPVMFIDPWGLTPIELRKAVESRGGTVVYNDDGTATATLGDKQMIYQLSKGEFIVSNDEYLWASNGRIVVEDTMFYDSFGLSVGEAYFETGGGATVHLEAFGFDVGGSLLKGSAKLGTSSGYTQKTSSDINIAIYGAERAQITDVNTGEIIFDGYANTYGPFKSDGKDITASFNIGAYLFVGAEVGYELNVGELVRMFTDIRHPELNKPLAPPSPISPPQGFIGPPPQFSPQPGPAPR